MLRCSELVYQPQSSQAMHCPMEDKLMSEAEPQKTTYDVFHPVLSLIPSHLRSSSTAPPSTQTVRRHSPNLATYRFEPLLDVTKSVLARAHAILPFLASVVESLAFLHPFLTDTMPLLLDATLPLGKQLQCRA